MTLLLAVLVTVQAAPVPPATAASEPVIVVTGTPLRDSQRRLATCIQQGCPPQQEIAATLAHAENLFIKGDYRTALQTTARGVSRNQRYGSQFPTEVAGLLRANSRIAGHLGEDDLRWSSTLDMASVLRAGLGRENSQVRIAEIEVGDALVRSGDLLRGEKQYLRVARRAAAAGDRRTEGLALLQRAIALNLASIDDMPMAIRARKVATELAASTVPDHRVYAEAANLLLVRMAARRGDTSLSDAALANMQPRPANEKPRLIYAKPLDIVPRGTANLESTITSSMAMQNFEGQWIDVGYRIGTSGEVTEAEVIRASDQQAGKWPELVLESIRSRRYAPIALPAGDPGVERVERYTWTSRLAATTGSRMRQRSATPRVEMMDLTVERPQVAANTR